MPTRGVGKNTAFCMQWKSRPKAIPYITQKFSPGECRLPGDFFDQRCPHLFLKRII